MDTVLSLPVDLLPVIPAAHPHHPLRRSLRIITLGWVFGAAWQAITTGTPLTVYAQSLHASPMQFGILTALPFLASILSLPASLMIDGTGKRKVVFLAGLYLQRLMWFPLALIPFYMLQHQGQAACAKAMLLFLVLSLIMHCGQGVGGPAWVSWMADIVPPRLFGKYFARRRQWAMVTAIPTAVAAGVLLDRWGGNSPSAQFYWCTIMFLIAAVFGLADISLFLFLGEAPRPPQAPAVLLRSFARPLHDNRFLLFSLFVGVLQFAMNLTGQFANLYLLDVVKIDNLGVQMMLFVGPMVAQLLVLPIWGLASDRVGIRPLLTISTLGMVPVGLAWCLLSPGHAWFGYLLSAAGTALWTGIEIANFTFVIKFAGDDLASGGSYIAVNTVIINIAGCLGGLAAGFIGQSLKDWHWQPLSHVRPATFFDVLFVGSSAIRLLAVLAFFPFLHEPTAHTLRGALRFIITTTGSGSLELIRGTAQRVRWRSIYRPAPAAGRNA